MNKGKLIKFHNKLKINKIKTNKNFYICVRT